MVILPYFIFQYATFVLKDKFEEFVLDKFQKAHESEVRWLQSLKSMPNGIVIYS